MIDRMKRIKEKGFAMDAPVDFAQIRVGAKKLEDAILTLGAFNKVNPRLADKNFILDAIDKYDLATMREISDFFYKTSGIYSRLCRYMAYLYRYDWMVTPYIQEDSVQKNKILKGFSDVLLYLDNFQIKRVLGDIALKVIKNGVYYGYIIQDKNSASIQELPAKYCRSRFTANGNPVVEFNMKFFDDQFKDAAQKLKVLNLFPDEFKKAYILFKQGKLQPDFQGDSQGWYLLDPNLTLKFNISGEDAPFFISVIPAIIDLDNAQELDRRKMAQKLLKIIIQKMPIDKNGDLVFDVDEARELHNNAVAMLQDAIGIDVLTTFADIDVADMADKSTTTTVDELEKVERTVYNESGTAQNLFNTDGNIALEKSILNDEASIYNLLLQFESFLNKLIAIFNNKKKIFFKVQLLTTTIYNYKEMSKLYKEQASMGYSKMLPQIALGQAQSTILANAYFENDIMDLVTMFVPPITSNQMNADALAQRRTGSNPSGTDTQSDDKKAGRTEKPDDEKSEKTIQNIEAQG